MQMICPIAHNAHFVVLFMSGSNDAKGCPSLFIIDAIMFDSCIWQFPTTMSSLRVFFFVLLCHRSTIWIHEKCRSELMASSWYSCSLIGELIAAPNYWWLFNYTDKACAVTRCYCVLSTVARHRFNKVFILAAIFNYVSNRSTDFCCDFSL